MSIFAIGDLHLSLHPEIDKPMDVFGSRWIDHHRRLEKAWKAIVSQEDTVILAGDISWGLRLDEALPDLGWIESFPGNKVIIKGNHDLWWSKITKLNQMYNTITFLQNTYYKVGDYGICGSRGWLCPGDKDYADEDEKIFKREVMRVKRSLAAAKTAGCQRIIGVTHYPPTNDKLENSEFTKLFTNGGVEIAVYGHLHGEEAFNKGISGINWGVDYRLVSLDYLNCIPAKIV